MPAVSLRKAINAKCRECIYDPNSGMGNWRQQVASCTSQTCPLWPARPISKKRQEGTVAGRKSGFQRQPSAE